MLLDLMRNFSLEGLLAFALLLPALVFSLSAHEWAHAFAAYKQGDSYAKYKGRMTFNPMAHLDPIGFISLLLVGFGWAKPVPVVPGSFKHPKKSELIVSLAGVTTNFFLAFFGFNIIYILYAAGVPLGQSQGLLNALDQFLFYFVYINIGLGVFNLLPIPPLDGYHVVKAFFYKWQNRGFFDFMDKYGMFILIIIVISDIGSGVIGTLVSLIYNGMSSLLDIIYSAFI